MSVYIKGFPLPNNCGACPLRLAWCRERIYMVTRPERCPFIPVPDHGRLVDADAFIEKQRELYCLDCNHRKGMKRGKLKIIYDVGEAPCRSCRLDDALYDLDEMPTIIPADNEEGAGE